jgi:type VI secretion system secreted protein VgrG
VMSGADTQFMSGGQMRIHSGQAIGVLAGAVKPGEGNVGLQLIAGKGAIEYQAQADELKLQARDQINVISANAHIDWAAAKSISLSTAGGANITIAGGNITVQCPGKITINAGTKNFSGPDRLTYPLPNLPNSNPPKEKVNFGVSLSDMPGAHGRALPDRPWNIVLLKMSATDAFESTHWRKVLASGTTDANGACVLTDEQKQAIWQEVSQHPQGVWLVSGPDATPMTFTRLTASAAELKARKTLDALNYALTPDIIDDAHRKLLSQWAELDYGTPLGAKPTDQTKA